MVNNAVFAKEQLLSIVLRIEGADKELEAIQDNKRDIYAEARGNGFDTKAIKAIVKLRRQDQGELDELQSIIDTYLRAISEAERAPTSVTKPYSIEYSTRAVA